MPPPIITRLSPSAGWPGGTTPAGVVVHGTAVVIHGRHFHPTPDMDRNRVSFTSAAGGEVDAPVEWASVDEIDYSAAGIAVRDGDVAGGLDHPHGLAVNRTTGDLYVADTDHDRIVRVAAGGAVSAWGASGSAAGEFSRPNGVAVDRAGFVYVADTLNHRIQKFDAVGNFVAAWGSHGSGVGELDMPVDIDVAELGGQTFAYVADSNNRRVARTDGNGGMATQLLAPADAGRILGVAAPRGYGYVYATDAARRRIYRWAWNGPFSGYFGAAGAHNLAVVEVGFPIGIEQDFDGYVYVADNAGRVVRKFDAFDPTFRQIAQFGLTIPAIPGPTPEDEFVDLVDVCVTDLKAAYGLDRQRKRVIRYVPSDAQELWVHVPAGAVSGQLRLRTDDGETTAGFIVWERAGVEIDAAYLTQGLVEYPLVAGKKTLIRYRMRTTGAAVLGSYHWGSPVHDLARCRVLKDGVEVATIDGSATFRTMTGGFMSGESGFDILFEIPPPWVNAAGSYRFDVSLARTGTPSFSDARSFSGSFANRRRSRIVASPVTHLRFDGTRVAPGDALPALFYVGGDTQHYLDWLDWQQLYSGYVHYNRLYPVRHSVADIAEYGIWVNGTMHDGIGSDDEVRDMLEVLELTRRRLNEDGGADYDFMLGIVDRNEVVGDQTWAGVTSDSHRAALISVGDNAAGVPAFDVGGIIGHELLHQYDVPEQSARERCDTAQEAWNAVTGAFVDNPVTLMYVPPPGTGRLYDWNDDTAFAEGRHGGAPGEYDALYEALANPHPPRPREAVLAADAPSRTGARRNFTLIGRLGRDGGFHRTSSWLGDARTPVTLESSDGDDRLVFRDAAGGELGSWRLLIAFGLRTVSATGVARRAGDDVALIAVTCPFPDATAAVELRWQGQAVWHAPVPAQGPSVSLVAPTGGEQIRPQQDLDVAWRAEHPLGAPMEFAVDYSSDGGKTFRPIAANVRETRCTWRAGLAASSGRVRLRVVASDGFNRASAASDELHVSDVARRAVIVRPRRGEVLPEGRPIRLLALASDIERGMIELNAANTVWKLDDELILARGNEVAVGDVTLATPKGDVALPLPPGAHRLRVEVTVAPGNVVSDEIPLVIAADSDRDGIPDAVEAAQGTDPNDPANVSTQAPVHPFGQWRFHRRGTYTLFQISHLLAGQTVLDLGFLDAAGRPLAEHHVRVLGASGLRTLATDAAGWVRVPLGSLGSVLVVLAAARRKPGAFGVARVRLAAESPLRETAILAHAWLRDSRSRRRATGTFHGTVVINAGKPLRVVGKRSPSTTTAAVALPEISHRTLGRLRLATALARRAPTAGPTSGGKPGT